MPDTILRWKPSEPPITAEVPQEESKNKWISFVVIGVIGWLIYKGVK